MLILCYTPANTGMLGSLGPYREQEPKGPSPLSKVLSKLRNENLKPRHNAELPILEIYMWQSNVNPTRHATPVSCST